MTPLQRLEAEMHRAIETYMTACKENETEELERMVTGLEDESMDVARYIQELKRWVEDRV